MSRPNGQVPGYIGRRHEAGSNFRKKNKFSGSSFGTYDIKYKCIRCHNYARHDANELLILQNTSAEVSAETSPRVSQKLQWARLNVGGRSAQRKVQIDMYAVEVYGPVVNVNVVTDFDICYLGASC